MASKLYIDVHVLQSVPPSNINRDDTGSPKQARYGGVSRARVSSQSWKRATRQQFWDGVDPVEHSTRTKRIHALLSTRVADRLGVDADVAAKIAVSALSDLKITLDKKPKKGEAAASPELSYLLFFGNRQIETLVDQIETVGAAWPTLDEKGIDEALAAVSAKDVLSNGHPIDVALFGRMVADLTALNVDASAQVAHAISTHAVSTEFDYFTAVDDEKARSTDEDAGAGMIGTIEFNSSTLYRYATVGFHQLVENLDGAEDIAADAVGSFVDAFVRSMPTGKSNTFANRTLPSVVVVVLRTDQPINLVAGFEAPVVGDHGLVGGSAAKLAAQFNEVQQQWATEPIAVFANYGSSISSELEATFGTSLPFPELVAAVADRVRTEANAGIGA